MKRMIRNIYYIVAHLYYKMAWRSFAQKIKHIRSSDVKPVFIFGTPIHRNIGDLAIAYAETQFVDAIEGFEAIPLSVPFIQANRNKLKSVIEESDVLAGHGGGNLGDTYPHEEDIRRFMIQEFPNNKIFIFPQTIYFSDTDKGRAFAQKSSDIYASHKDLTIIAREKTSFGIASKYFADNNVLLTPDIVLSLKLNHHKQERHGVLLCLRNDIEKTLNNDNHNTIVNFARKVSDDIQVTDTVSSDRLFVVKKKNIIVRNKLRQFSGVELIITDRLHGMVFAAITGTPCIVFSNFNHKVSGTYDWIKSLEYVKFCNTVNDLDIIDEKELMKSMSPHDPDRFNEHWEMISKLITN